MANSVSQPCDAIDVLVDVSVEVLINRIVGVWSIGARDNVVITDVTTNTEGIALEFIVTSLWDVDALGDVRAGVTIDSVTGIGIDVLAAVVTALNFILPSLLEESALWR